MNLEQYVKENPTATLEEIQAVSETIDTKQVGSGQARGFFVNEECIGEYTGMKLWTLFNIAANDLTNPLFPLASAIVITASDAQSYFGMDVTKADGVANRVGLAGLVAMGIMSQETADKFIAKTLSTNTPFTAITQSQLNSAKGLFASKTITHTAGKHIALTLNVDLSEKVAATAWVKETGFADENAGRNAHIQTAQKYRIDMSGKKSGEYEVRVPLLDADFSVESV